MSACGGASSIAGGVRTLRGGENNNNKWLDQAQRRGMSKSTGFDAEVLKLYRIVNTNLVPMWAKIVETVGKESGGKGSVLDLASGPGNPSMQLAEAFPQLKVKCTDASPDMVDKAKALAKEKGLYDKLEFEVLDLEDLSAIPSGSQDMVTVSLGFMFPEDLKKSVEEVHRVTKPGGTLVTTVWREVPMMELVADVMEELLNKKLPPPAINPLSLKENSALDGPLQDAGFEIKSSEELPITFNLGTREEAWQVGTLFDRAMLNELQESGEEGDVFGKFRTIFEEKAEGMWIQDGDSEVLCMPDPGIYRLVVAKKPL